MTRSRVLVVVPVFNGRDFVPRCIRSAIELDRRSVDIDVLILDDCSPEPGWSEWLAAYCASLGAYYYRNPVNIGIVRNFNLGFRSGVEDGYDYVLIANSDTILAHNMIDSLVAAAESDPAIGSVTAWSNNVSFCSIPNECTEQSLGDADVVNWIGDELADEFAATVLDVPAGTGSALFVPSRVLSDIGYLDNVFDRGYCEETDWTQRSIAHGYRVVLGLGSFAYHIGSASSRAAGLIGPMETSVAAHEAIIDLRYPHFRDQIDAFVAGEALRDVGTRALRRLIGSAVSTWGYDLEISPAFKDDRAGERPVCWLAPDDPSQARVWFRGFSEAYALDAEPLVDSLRRTFQRLPSSATVSGSGQAAGWLTKLGVPVRRDG